MHVWYVDAMELLIIFCGGLVLGGLFVYSYLRTKSAQERDTLNATLHQVKSPLTALRGYIAMFLDKEYGEVETKAHEALVSMKKANDYMLTLVEEYKDFAELDRGRISIIKKEVDVGTCVGDIVRELETHARMSRHTLTYHAPEKEMILSLDVRRMRQVIHNIISNAFAYTESGSTIEIRVIDTGPVIRITISDDGPGIPAEEREKIFKRFKRGTHGRLKSGTGLGLYIARVIMHSHGGRLYVDPEHHDTGAVFLIELKK